MSILRPTHDYVQRVQNFAAFLGRSPDTASFEDVRRYQLHQALAGPQTPLPHVCRLPLAQQGGDAHRRLLLSARAGVVIDHRNAACLASRDFAALQDDVKELTEAQRQAAYTIATVKAAEQELRRQAPAPFWYSNPEALNPVIARGPQSAAASPLPRRPPGGRAEPRAPRERETAAPSSPPPPR